MARGTIVVETNRCKGCELCTTVCPQDVLVMGDSFNARGYKPVVLVDPENKCTGCALCAVICPDAVITVFRLCGRSSGQSAEKRVHGTHVTSVDGLDVEESCGLVAIAGDEAVVGNPERCGQKDAKNKSENDEPFA